MDQIKAWKDVTYREEVAAVGHPAGDPDRRELDDWEVDDAVGGTIATLILGTFGCCGDCRWYPFGVTLCPALCQRP